jgi:hypothetical protein
VTSSFTRYEAAWSTKISEGPTSMKDRKDIPDYDWVASQLNKLATRTNDGSVSFNFCHEHIRFSDILTILESIHKFDIDIPSMERSRILREAVGRVAAQSEVTEKKLKIMIRQLTNQFTDTNATNFALSTTLSIRHFKELPRITFDNARFVFSSTLPPAFARNKIDGFVDTKPPDDLPSDFTNVRVIVQARSVFEAYERAIDSLDFLRGIWNFVINRTIDDRWYSGRVKPVNQIRLGPVHTLHFENGKPASPIYWYENLYPKESRPETVRSWPEIAKGEKVIRSLILKSKYSCDLKTIFQRYARSLDSSDHNSDFLKLWSLLEFLTGIKPGENYAEVIRRTLFLSPDPDYDERILQHLRDRRNASIHQAETSNWGETHLFQLKRHVELLMHFHIQVGREYLSVEEIGKLLARPRDSAALYKRIEELRLELRLNKNALRLRKDLS